MSNILKCPYCCEILEQSSIFNLNSYTCTNLTCNGYNMSATKDMWQELIRTRKELEQSETCCAEWEKEALDYKAENIALSGDLECTRKALDVALDEINKIKVAAESVGIGFFMTAAISASVKIKTALEQKDIK